MWRDTLDTMKPLTAASQDHWADLRFVFTDIDDTLTTNGRLFADAYTMIENLADAGIVVIPVTGRPAGWCDMIARFWPVGAVVGENGAFYFRYDRGHRKFARVFSQSEEERQENRRALNVLRDQILADVPGAGVASDQPYREVDLAIDCSEDVPRLADDAISKIVEHFERAGATAKISSIHVNGWFGTHDKLTMTHQLLRDVFDLDIALASSQQLCAFIGDSPNDSPMFDYFENSVGVANIKGFGDNCPSLPKWVTAASSSAGFCEFARAVIAARKG